MSVNEGSHPDNESQCRGCGGWFDDQTLTRCACESLLCDSCHSPRPAFSPETPTRREMPTREQEIVDAFDAGFTHAGRPSDTEAYNLGFEQGLAHGEAIGRALASRDATRSQEK